MVIVMASFNLMHAYLVSRFYEEETHHDIESSRLAAMLVGMILNSADWEQIRPAQGIKAAYKDAGIDLDFDVITTAYLRDELAKKDKKFSNFLENWHDDMNYILSHTNIFFILSAVIVLSFTKKTLMRIIMSNGSQGAS